MPSKYTSFLTSSTWICQNNNNIKIRASVTLARLVIPPTISFYSESCESSFDLCLFLKNFHKCSCRAVYDLQLRTDPVQKKKGHQSCTLLVELPIWSECTLFLKYKNYSIKMTTIYRKNNSYIAA